jgi:hypothetical protein
VRKRHRRPGGEMVSARTILATLGVVQLLVRSVCVCVCARVCSVCVCQYVSASSSFLCAACGSRSRAPLLEV